MKSIFRYALAVVVSVSTFAACSNDDTQDPITPREVAMTVVASSDLDSSAPQSRTGFDPATGAVYWNQSGEFLKVFETAGTKTTPKDSAEGIVTDNGAKASFGVSFSENATATAFTYNAIYPASAWVEKDNTDVAKLKVTTPDTQSPAETSFDPAADLLIALPVTSGIQPSELDMRFKRMVAVGKMTIKALASSDPITSIVFTAPGKKVTGRSYLNLSEGTAEYGYQGQSNDNLTLTFASDRNFTTDNQTYFTCFPFELAAGDKFSVTIKAGNKTFTKEVALGEGRSLAFAAGASSTFTVNMSGIEGVETKTLDGDYVIVAKQNDVYYAMSSEADGSRLAAKTIEYDGISEKFATTDATIIWNIAKDGDNYTITNAKKFLSWVSGNGATTGDSSYALSITPNDDGTYKIGSVADTKRILAKNETPKYGFAFYTGTQTNNLLLIKVGEDTRTPLATPTLDEPAVEGNTITISWNTVEGAKDYTITYNDKTVTTEDDTTIYELTDLSYNTEYSISVIANPTDTENFKASAPSEPVTATTETDPNAGQGGIITFDYVNSITDANSKTIDGITISYAKGDGSSTPAYNTNSKELRIYKANTFTLTSNNTDITKVEITFSSKSYMGADFGANVGNYTVSESTGTWTGNAKSITFANGTSSSTNTQARIKTIVVTYGEGGGDTPTPEPSITVNKSELNFAAENPQEQTVTVTKTNADDCTIDATITVDNKDIATDHFNATVNGNTVTVTADANESDAAITGTLTINLMKDGVAVATETITLSQAKKAEGGETGTEITITKNTGLQASTTATVMDENISYVNSADNTYSDPMRIYANNTFTITASSGNITTVIFNCNTSTYATNASKATVTVDQGATVTASVTDKVTTYTITGNTSKIAIKPTAQVRVDAITVKYTN